jgi:hypothetical protein
MSPQKPTDPTDPVEPRPLDWDLIPDLLLLLFLLSFWSAGLVSVILRLLF